MRGVFTRKTQQTEEDRAVSYAHRDQIAVSRCVRDVAGTQKRCLRKRSAHADQLIGAPRQHIGPRNPRSIGIRRRQQQLLPCAIEMPVVPERVFLDHRAGGGVRRDVLGPALAHHPDLAPVAQRLAIIGTRPHAALQQVSTDPPRVNNRPRLRPDSTGNLQALTLRLAANVPAQSEERNIQHNNPN